MAGIPSVSLDPLRTVPANQHQQVKDLASKALVEEKLGNYPEALKLYTMALTAQPGQPYLREALDRLSRQIHKRGERRMTTNRAHFVEEALRRSEVTGFKQDEVAALSLEGQRLLTQGLPLSAVRKLHQALEKDPKDEVALDGIARAKRKIDRRLQKGRFESPQQYAAYLGMGRYLSGDWLGAIEALERSVRTGPVDGEMAVANLPAYAAAARVALDHELWKGEREEVLKQARFLYDEGRWEEAEPLFKRILTADPDDKETRFLADVVFQKAEELREKEREELRRQELAEALSEAKLAAQSGDSLTVLEFAAQALVLDPENQEALGYLKASQERLQKQGFLAPEVAVMDNAEEAYRRALRHYGNDEPDEALKALQEALNAKPDHAEAKALMERLTAPAEPIE